MNYEEFKSKCGEKSKFLFVLDIIKNLVDYNIKNSLLSRLYKSNIKVMHVIIKKNTKLMELKDKITLYGNKLTIILILNDQIEKELQFVEKDHYSDNILNINLIKKYNLIEKYKIIILSEGNRYIFKRKSKYKNYINNIDSMIQWTETAKEIVTFNNNDKNQCVRKNLIDTPKNLKKSRNQAAFYKKQSIISKNGLTANTEGIDKYITNFVSFNYKENSQKLDVPNNNFSQINISISNEKQIKVNTDIEILNDFDLNKKPKQLISRSNSITEKKEIKIEIEGANKSNCYCCF